VHSGRIQRMVVLAVAVFTLLMAGAWGRPPITLSPHAEEVARQIGFDRQVLIIVKEETQEHIQRLTGYDENDYQIMVNGISVDVPADRSNQLLARLRARLKPLNYMAFVVSINTGLKQDTIGVIKGADQYDILRIMQTNGDEFDILNEDVVTRLKEWEKTFSFDIVGADNDWVEIEFKTLPKDLAAFAEEVYDFCPDAVDQGPGSVSGLVKEMQATRRLFLWWD
jgi:hypothetical protein